MRMISMRIGLHSPLVSPYNKLDWITMQKKRKDRDNKSKYIKQFVSEFVFQEFEHNFENVRG